MKVCVWNGNEHLEAVRGRPENVQALRRAGDVNDPNTLGVGLAEHVSSKVYNLCATLYKNNRGVHARTTTSDVTCAWSRFRALLDTYVHGLLR